MSVFVEILKMNFYMSILILTVIILKGKILGKYTTMFNYILYIGISLKMIFIFRINIPTPFSLKETEYTYEFKNLGYVDNIIEESGNKVNFIEIISYIWLAGMLGITLYYIYYHVKFYRSLRILKQEVSDMNVLNILENQKNYLNIKRNIKVSTLEGIYSPMLVGVLKTEIILPNRGYKDKDLNYIFRHELIHYKRKDNLLKIVVMLANIIYWFNPIIYLFKRNFNEICELSCDELVTKEYTVNEVKEYSLILLDMMKYKNKLSSSICVSQLNTNKVNIIKSRIEIMLNSKKRKSGVMVGMMLFTLTVISMISFNTKQTVYSRDYIEEKSVKIAGEFNTSKGGKDLIVGQVENVIVTDSNFSDSKLMVDYPVVMDYQLNKEMESELEKIKSKLSNHKGVIYSVEINKDNIILLYEKSGKASYAVSINKEFYKS